MRRLAPSDYAQLVGRWCLFVLILALGGAPGAHLGIDLDLLPQTPCLLDEALHLPGSVHLREAPFLLDEELRLSEGIHPGLDLRARPRLLHEALQLPGGIRPAEVHRGVERFAAETEWVTVNRQDLVVAPFLMQRVLGLRRGEYLQLRANRDSVRLELRMSWR